MTLLSILLLLLLSVTAAWESCADLVVEAVPIVNTPTMNKRACVTVSLNNSLLTGSMQIGERRWGPATLNLDSIDVEEFGRAPQAIFDCVSIGMPGAKACVRITNLILQPRRLSGCAHVSEEVLGHVVATRDLGCVHLPNETELYILHGP
jgi:hypothetical protein